MAVFKIEKNRNYTTMSNYHLRDKNLSYKAKGLLSFMLSLPESWDYSMNGLVSVSKENIRAIRTILQELEEYKYLVRTRMQNEKGQFKYDYSIYEVPYTQLPHIQNPYMDNPRTNIDTQININKINKKKINTNSLITQDKLDKTLNPLVNELIRRKFIEENDLDIYKYSDFFYELLEKYEYMHIVISTGYIINKFKKNKGLDERGYPIENKFYYFKTSLINNLTRNDEFEDEWGY